MYNIYFSIHDVFNSIYLKCMIFNKLLHISNNNTLIEYKLNTNSYLSIWTSNTAYILFNNKQYSPIYLSLPLYNQKTNYTDYIIETNNCISYNGRYYGKYIDPIYLFKCRFNSNIIKLSELNLS